MSWLRLKTGGRGGGYSLRRGLMESWLRVAYTGHWPARLWSVLPGTTQVRVVHRVRGCSAQHGFKRLRVAFASDLHIGPTTPEATLERAFDEIARARPDVLLLGGDYVFLDVTERTLDTLGRLLSRVPRQTAFAVMGNHDLWTDSRALEDRLEASGVRVLNNRTALLPAPFADVGICGLDEPWTGRPDADECLRDSAAARLLIGLCHSPDGIHYLRNRGVALLLCGHTHGGQIALPGNRALVLPEGPYSKRLVAGDYTIEDLDVFVSKGVGATDLPIRTFAQPEVTIVDFLRQPV